MRERGVGERKMENGGSGREKGRKRSEGGRLGGRKREGRGKEGGRGREREEGWEKGIKGECTCVREQLGYSL